MKEFHKGVFAFVHVASVDPRASVHPQCMGLGSRYYDCSLFLIQKPQLGSSTCTRLQKQAGGTERLCPRGTVQRGNRNGHLNTSHCENPGTEPNVQCTLDSA